MLNVPISHTVSVAGDRTQTGDKAPLSWNLPCFEGRKEKPEQVRMCWIALAVISVMWKPCSRAEAWQSQGAWLHFIADGEKVGRWDWESGIEAKKCWR